MKMGRDQSTRRNTPNLVAKLVKNRQCCTRFMFIFVFYSIVHCSFAYFSSNLTTFSTCGVWGNMSTGCTAATR